MTQYSVRRRTLLRAAIIAGSPAGAGCLDDHDDDAPEDDGDSPDDDADISDDADIDDDDTEQPESYRVETVVDGLTHPWAIDPAPGEPAFLVTERPGSLLRIDTDTGSTTEIGGTPTVFAEGQGGLLDVTVHPDYPNEPWIYLTYSAEGEGGSAAHLGRGQLRPDDDELTDFEAIYIAEPFIESNGHYGSRIVFGDDGMVYLTSGDRQIGDFGPDHPSQDTTNEIGTTLRLEPDGSIPDDNPLVDQDDAIDSIYSYGHRNSQGITVHPETGELWQSEHGEEDGDVINVIEEGKNYGWPIAHYGCHYGTNDPVAEDPDERDDVVNPVYYWECNSGGFPPAGMTFYHGDAFPGWEGDLFVGNLAGQYLGHFAVDGREVDELDPLLADEGWRIRDVAVGPETGYLYVTPDETEAEIVRLVPS